MHFKYSFDFLTEPDILSADEALLESTGPEESSHPISISFPRSASPQTLKTQLNIQNESSIENTFTEMLNPVKILEVPFKIPVNALIPTITTEYLAVRRNDNGKPNMLRLTFNFNRDVLHRRKLVRKFVVENVLR